MQDRKDDAVLSAEESEAYLARMLAGELLNYRQPAPALTGFAED